MSNLPVPFINGPLNGETATVPRLKSGEPYPAVYVPALAPELIPGEPGWIPQSDQRKPARTHVYYRYVCYTEALDMPTYLYVYGGTV